MKRGISLLIVLTTFILSFSDFVVYAEENDQIPEGRKYVSEENIGSAIVTADVTYDENDEIILGDEIDLASVPMPMAVEGETCLITPYSQTLWYGSWSTCKFDVKTSTGTNRGYCAQPQTPTPSGYYTVSKIDGSTEIGKKLKIALMFGENGPWYSESTALFGGCSWSAVYAYLHAMVSIVYSGQTTGLTSTQVQAIQGAIDQQYKERGNLSILDEYTVYVAYNDKQDIVWLEKVKDSKPILPSIDLKILKRVKDSEKVIPGTIFRCTLPNGTTQDVTTGNNGQVTIQDLSVGKYTVEEVSVPEGYLLNLGKVVFEVSEDGTVTVVENTAVEQTGYITLRMEDSENAVMVVEDVLAPYTLNIIKANEKDTKLQGAEFAIYEDEKCTQEKKRVTTDENGNAYFENLEVGKSYYLKEIKAPQGYNVVEEEGKEIVYEVKAESSPVDNLFEYYINGEKCTEVSGTKAERIVKLSLTNYSGLELPETGTQTVALLFICGMAGMTGVLLYSVKKRKNGEKTNEEN